MTGLEHFESNGFAVCKDLIDQSALYNLIYYKENWDIPQRGHDLDGTYYNSNYDSVEWGNYWTEALTDHVDVIEIEENVGLLVKQFMENPVFYHSDVSVLMPGSKQIRPHIDTPHRHELWNHQIRNRLGIQVAIPMQAYTEHSGSTAFLPGSHQRYWNIKQCYRGEYTGEFLSDCVQPDITFGDMIMWDARTLHSQMMNTTGDPRYMLLFNYVEKSILDRLVEYENSL